MNILHRRDDGTFVIERDGMPYHVTLDDPIHAEVEAAAEGLDLPPEPPPFTLVLPEPSPEQAYRLAIAAHVEATAQARGYDSAVSCASYVASSVTAWAAEAAVFVAWRDAVWTVAFDALAAWQAGGAAPPAPAAFVAALPAIEWPAA